MLKGVLGVMPASLSELGGVAPSGVPPEAAAGLPEAGLPEAELPGPGARWPLGGGYWPVTTGSTGSGPRSMYSCNTGSAAASRISSELHMPRHTLLTSNASAGRRHEAQRHS